MDQPVPSVACSDGRHGDGGENEQPQIIADRIPRQPHANAIIEGIGGNDKGIGQSE
jgi:hypothetical protein